MKKELKTKVFTIFMAFLVAVISIPVSVFADVLIEGTSDVDTENVEIYDSLEQTSATEEIVVLEEKEELREENVKHFKLSDGTIKAVVYPQAVHYKNDAGKWIDIDNTLVLKGSEYSTSNKSVIKFANKSGSSGLVAIKDGKYKIDFTPVGSNMVNVLIENSQGTESRKFESVSRLNELTSKAT